MKDVQDRIVQYANRYKLTNVETGAVLGTFDFDEETGTVQQVGTEIDAELFDSIANDLAKRVRVDAKQNFSAEQKQQARANIDAAGTNGNYPNMGAGYLARRAFVGEFASDQWVKWATVSAPVGVRASILFLVNGGQDPINEGSGLLELNLVRQVENVSLVVCSGYIKSENFAYVINGTSIDLYVYCLSNRDYQIAVLDELIGTATNKNTYVTFSNVGTGSSTAPEGAVYGIVRNYASADGSGWPFEKNYLWCNNEQPQINMLRDGTTSLDLNDYVEEGKYEVQGFGDTALVNFPTSSSNTSETNCDWYLRVYRRSPKYVTQVAYSVRADGAIAIRVLSNGTWGAWRLLFEDGVAQSIPVASETVFGGAKMWVDGGKLYIKTE